MVSPGPWENACADYNMLIRWFVGLTMDDAVWDATTRHPGYALSQRTRMGIEEIFGWLETVALLRKTRHRGTARVEFYFPGSLAE